MLARGCLWRLHVTSEELLGSLGTLLLETLWVILAFVCLEQLVRICSSRDNHGSVSASPEHTLIMGDVLREVRFLVDPAIWVLILLFLGHDAGMGSKALATTSSRI